MSRTPRFLSLLCLFLIVSSLPGYCDPQPVLIPVTARYQAGVEGRQPDTSKVPGRLALAGLLLIPLDNELAKTIRLDPGEKTDGVTEAANSLGTAKVLIPILGGMYVLGDREDKDTVKQAVSALASAAIVTQGMKYLTGRARPNMPDSGDFKGPGAGKGYTSFPSGHTSAAFAVATVLANKHPNQEWLYYGLASAVGVARVRKSAHFPSDVLVGAAVGMYAGNRAVEGGPRMLSIRF